MEPQEYSARAALVGAKRPFSFTGSFFFQARAAMTSVMTAHVSCGMVSQAIRVVHLRRWVMSDPLGTARHARIAVCSLKELLDSKGKVHDDAVAFFLDRPRPASASSKLKAKKLRQAVCSSAITAKSRNPLPFDTSFTETSPTAPSVYTTTPTPAFLLNPFLFCPWRFGRKLNWLARSYVRNMISRRNFHSF
jgi:hypothetical protein